MFNDMKRIDDLKSLKVSLDQYYKDFGKYPVSSSTYEIVDFKTNKAISWGFAWDPYMSALPKDSGGRRYVYYSSPQQQSYWLYASLEDGMDSPNSCHKGAQCDSIAQNNINIDACGQEKICNFGLSSGNVSP